MVNAIEQRYTQITDANRQRPDESKGAFYSRLVQETEEQRRAAGEDPHLNGIWEVQNQQNQDTVDLSSMSYEQRLAELQKIHENTDYSGMEQKDIYRLIFQRFQDAFPNYWAIGGGLYLCAGENSVYTKVWSELSQQFSEANNGAHLQWPSDPAEKISFNRYVHGYDADISDEELIETLKEKYSGGTLADRCGMAWEMHSMGLMDAMTTDAIVRQVQTEMVQRTEGRYGHLFRDNPIRVNAMIGVAENTQLSWTQLVKNTYDEQKTWRYESEAIKAASLQALEERLSKLLERLKLTVPDGLFAD